MSVIPADYVDLLEKPAIAMFSSIGPKHEPQATPVWFRWDPENDEILVSLMRSRQKFRNVQRDPRVSLAIIDPLTSYRYLEVRGTVSAIEDDPEKEFVDELSDRYLGMRPFPLTEPGDERLIVHITPVHCTWQG